LLTRSPCFLHLSWWILVLSRPHSRGLRLRLQRRRLFLLLCLIRPSWLTTPWGLHRAAWLSHRGRRHGNVTAGSITTTTTTAVVATTNHLRPSAPNRRTTGGSCCRSSHITWHGNNGVILHQQGIQAFFERVHAKGFAALPLLLLLVLLMELLLLNLLVLLHNHSICIWTLWRTRFFSKLLSLLMLI
jgi:hypothetical protein